MNAEFEKHKAEFLAAVRGIEGRHVTRALSWQTHGIDWRDSPKARMAEAYAQAKMRTPSAYELMRSVDLAKLAAQARARAAGDPYWRNTPKGAVAP